MRVATEKTGLTIIRGHVLAKTFDGILSHDVPEPTAVYTCPGTGQRSSAAMPLALPVAAAAVMAVAALEVVAGGGPPADNPCLTWIKGGWEGADNRSWDAIDMFIPAIYSGSLSPEDHERVCVMTVL